MLYLEKKKKKKKKEKGFHMEQNSTASLLSNKRE